MRLVEENGHGEYFSLFPRSVVCSIIVQIFIHVCFRGSIHKLPRRARTPWLKSGPSLAISTTSQRGGGKNYE